MTGMARDTGLRTSFDVHLAQSIADILGTPKGTRVMRRRYGSDLPALIDAPINGSTIVDLFMAVAEALGEWEPRLVLSRVQVQAASAGRVQLSIEGEVAGRAERLDVEIRGRA